MGWFLRSALLILLATSRVFRAVVLLLLAIATIGAVAAVRQDDANYLRARQLVPSSDVDLGDLTLSKTLVGSDVWDLTGRVRNRNAEHAVVSAKVRLWLQDCEAGRDGQPDLLRCDTIGQTDKDLALDVPPGQVRDVRAAVWFLDAIVQRQMAWRMQVIEIVGE